MNDTPEFTPAEIVIAEDPQETEGANDAWQLAHLERAFQLRAVRRLCIDGARFAEQRGTEVERARTFLLHRPERQRARRHRLRIQVALQHVAAERAQQLLLGLGLDAFGDDLQTEGVGELDDGELVHVGEAGRILKELKQALQTANQERERLESERKKQAGIVGEYAIDFDAARLEIGRRLACLRTAGGQGSVSGQP